MGIRRIIIIITFCLSGRFAISQTDGGQLSEKINTAKEDSNKVKMLIDISKDNMSSDPALAKIYANEAKRISININYKPGIAHSYKVLGLISVMQGKYVETLDYYENAIAVFDELGNKSGVANILSNIGTLYFNQSDDAKALEYDLRALKVAEQTSDSSRISTILLNIGAVYAHKKLTYAKAEEYYLRAYDIIKKLLERSNSAANNKDSSSFQINPSVSYVKNEDYKIIKATIESNLGELKFLAGDYSSAINYFKESLIAYNESENTPYALNWLGKTYKEIGETDKAIQYHQQALAFSKKINAPIDIAQSYLGLGDAYSQKGDYKTAINNYKSAEEIAVTISSANDEMKVAYLGLAIAYAKQNDFNSAYQYQVLYSGIKDSLYNIDTDKKLSSLQFNFDIQKKQSQLDILTKDKALSDLNAKRQKTAKNILMGGIAIVLIVTMIIYRNYRQKLRTNKILDKQKAEIEGLLLNILPAEVAHELQEKGVADPRYYDKVSVLFTDFKEFSHLADGLTPQEVIAVLNEYFIAFDDIIVKYNLEKIKTIGDSYMCAGGIPIPDEGHVLNIIKASLEIRDFITTNNIKRNQHGLPPWDVRIGIHTGPAVAGVVGRKKYAYDIWGGTVNIASRMESNGEPGKVNISASTFELIKHKYNCTYRGKIYAKNIGDIDMYFVDGEVAVN